MFSSVLPTSQQIVLCFGHITLDKIDNFTAPADAFGAHITNVTYTTRFTDQQPWLENKQLLNVYPGLKYAIENAAKPKTMTLVLTNKGWEDPQSSSK